ncbi:MAG: zinc-binding dehydrogenase [Gammaproteobacteria bacterium]|nr:zinc-binding dehydrogenase [Gammaproteobacteria bacterium]
MKTRAAVVKKSEGEFCVEELELGPLQKDEVLVKISGAGICHTDLIARDQVYPVPLPCVFGHEGSGVVERVGDNVSKLSVGDHVVLSFGACGECRNCLQGVPSRCLKIFECNFTGCRHDGSLTYSSTDNNIHASFFTQSSFAEYAIANEQNTVKVDKAVPLEMLGPLGCGIQTGAGAVLNTLQPAAGSSIAIFGCGSVGMAALMAAKAIACSHIVAIDLIDERLQLAQQLGATLTINPTEENVIEKIHQLTGDGVDYTVECTALPAVFRQAVDSLNNTGTCALVGAAAPGEEVTLDMNSIMFGRTVTGVIEGDAVPDIFIPQLINLYQQGQFPFDKLIEFYPLDDVQRAVEDMEAGKVIKPVLRP